MYHKFDKSIFREYDIRGIIAKSLRVVDAYYIGQNFARQLKKKYNSCNVVVGFDGRISSPILEKKLIEGLYDAGAAVTRIGLCSSPMLYYGCLKLKLDGGIMITGSHNPSNYNGFKILTSEKSYYGKDILSLNKGNKPLNLKGKIVNYNIRNSYISDIYDSSIKIRSDLKVVWDPGNGATGELLENLVKQLPGKHIIINSEIDGTFPSHHPDPTEERNLIQLKNEVKKLKADIGLAFDGDGDRIGAIDSNGKIISGDKLLLLFASDILKENPGATIIGDVKVSEVVFSEIYKKGGNPIMWKTGHSLIKAKMKETGALLAGEMSGHIFFADKYYGFDDGVYAAVRLLNIISSNIAITKVLSIFDNFFSTPEIKIECPDNVKFLAIKKIKKFVIKKYKNINCIDGVRVNTSKGWFLIRASNTQPALIIRCEAKEEKSLINLVKEVKKIVSVIGKNENVVFNFRL